MLSAGLSVHFGVRYHEKEQLPLIEMTKQAENFAAYLDNFNQTATVQPSPSPTLTSLPDPTSPATLQPTATVIPTPTPNPHAAELQKALSLVEINFPAWQSLNPNVQAWIHNEAIHVDLPVLKAPDNEYYLTRDIDLSYKEMGSVFFDFRSNTDFSDLNTIIYGHNFDNDLMFSNLVWYKTQRFYEKNPYYYLYTPEQVYRVDVAAGIIVSETDITYLEVNFESTQDFRDLIQKIEANSVIKTDTKLSQHDQLVTLYTCTNDWQGQRFVVIGKLTPLGAFSDQ